MERSIHCDPGSLPQAARTLLGNKTPVDEEASHMRGMEPVFTGDCRARFETGAAWTSYFEPDGDVYLGKPLTC